MDNKESAPKIADQNSKTNGKSDNSQTLSSFTVDGNYLMKKFDHIDNKIDNNFGEAFTKMDGQMQEIRSQMFHIVLATTTLVGTFVVGRYGTDMRHYSLRYYSEILAKLRNGVKNGTK